MVQPLQDSLLCRDVRAAVDLCHRDGSLKREVAENPAKYIHEVQFRGASASSTSHLYRGHASHRHTLKGQHCLHWPARHGVLGSGGKAPITCGGPAAAVSGGVQDPQLPKLPGALRASGLGTCEGVLVVSHVKPCAGECRSRSSRRLGHMPCVPEKVVIDHC